MTQDHLSPPAALPVNADRALSLARVGRRGTDASVAGAAANDRFMLCLGTMFSPIQDRGAPGAGFTHRLGDIVAIARPSPGALVNTVQRSDVITPWTYGVGALLKHLRGGRMPAH